MSYNTVYKTIKAGIVKNGVLYTASARNGKTNKYSQITKIRMLKMKSYTHQVEEIIELIKYSRIIPIILYNTHIDNKSRNDKNSVLCMIGTRNGKNQ